MIDLRVQHPLGQCFFQLVEAVLVERGLRIDSGQTSWPIHEFPDTPAATGRLLAEAVNADHESPILHGEIGAIDACARSHPRLSWPEVTLYTTAEPCPMYAAAIAWTGIGEVMIGSRQSAAFGISQVHIACAAVLRAAPLYQGRLIVGILADRTKALYADWAARLRLGAR